MSEAPTGLFGGRYMRFFDSGSRYSPERKKVMEALWSRASLRNRGKRPLPTSPAPSQEKTTNWGGFWPGFSRSGSGGWWGCLPVCAVEPSPIGFDRGFCCPGLAATLPESDEPEGEQPATDRAAAAPTPSPSIPRRL